MKKNLAISLISLLFHINASAQEALITVNGKVTDSDTGMSIPGAHIIEQGTSHGVMTDFNGEFSIDVSEDAVLEVSFIGFATTEIQVGGQTELEVSLKPTVSALDEVVVVGYGTQKKGSIIGAVSQVNSEDLENRSVTRLSEALTGQMPGVTIIQRSGRPGYSAGDISVRGVGSFGQILLLWF